MPDLARLHQLRHCADRGLDRRLWIYSVLIVKIDVINAQPLQTSFASFLHVIGLAVDTTNIWIAGIADDSKLCGQYNTVALSLNRSTNQLFIRIRSINVRRIEEVDAKFKSAMNGGDRFCIIAPRIKLRHAHAA